MPDEVIREQVQQRADSRGDARLAWLREARFGMFIHWGLYAIPAGSWKGRPIEAAGEWIMRHGRIPVGEYERLAEEFNPVGFDADAWVRLAKDAGQKYIVITAKHHDGFCLFDSAVSNYDVVDATPFGRDPLAELARACADHGLRLGFYYSQTQDWHHSDGRGNDWDYDEATKDFDGYLRSYVEPQLRELLTNYGPIGLIWFDTPKDITTEQSRRLVKLVHGLQPDCLVNGRIGNGLGDYAQAGDNRIPDGVVGGEWEVPATLNNTWGYRADDEDWKPVPDLVHKLVDIASKGGNYLLNVGPTARGTIPQESAIRLRAVGRWLDQNGPAIYGTTAGPMQGVPGIRTTAQGDTVYVHVLDWPADGRVRLPRQQIGLTELGRNTRLLTDPNVDLSIDYTSDELVINAPESAPDPIDTVIVLQDAVNSL